LLFFVPAGPVLYYFIVYRRSPVLRETTSAVEKRVAVAN
jgi:hypothetical protein